MASRTHGGGDGGGWKGNARKAASNLPLSLPNDIVFTTPILSSTNLPARPPLVLCPVYTPARTKARVHARVHTHVHATCPAAAARYTISIVPSITVSRHSSKLSHRYNANGVAPATPEGGGREGGEGGGDGDEEEAEACSRARTRCSLDPPLPPPTRGWQARSSCSQRILGGSILEIRLARVVCMGVGRRERPVLNDAAGVSQVRRTSIFETRGHILPVSSPRLMIPSWFDGDRSTNFSN